MHFWFRMCWYIALCEAFYLFPDFCLDRFFPYLYHFILVLNIYLSPKSLQCILRYIVIWVSQPGIFIICFENISEITHRKMVRKVWETPCSPYPDSPTVKILPHLLPTLYSPCFFEPLRACCRHGAPAPPQSPRSPVAQHLNRQLSVSMVLPLTIEKPCLLSGSESPVRIPCISYSHCVSVTFLVFSVFSSFKSYRPSILTETERPPRPGSAKNSVSNRILL